MSLYLLKKIGLAIVESYKSFCKTPSPKLIMTLLVKNEEDMLEKNLQFHKAMGVDGFIITDNNSTDCNLDIIRKYQEKGWILEYIEETDTEVEKRFYFGTSGTDLPYNRICLEHLKYEEPDDEEPPEDESEESEDTPWWEW